MTAKSRPGVEPRAAFCRKFYAHTEKNGKNPGKPEGEGACRTAERLRCSDSCVKIVWNPSALVAVLMQKRSCLNGPPFYDKHRKAVFYVQKKVVFDKYIWMFGMAAE